MILLTLKDSKRIWEKIDWNGKLKCESIKPDAMCNDFADFIEERCCLPAEQSFFSDIKTKTKNTLLDSKITEDEVISAARRMKSSSSSKCGIPIPLFMLTILSFVTVLTKALNNIFFTKYPKCWSAVIKCLPKKGKLDIPNLRGIGLKNLFAKLYDAILKNRLEKWLKIPQQQTAYQKGKGCHMHVFYVRCLIAICKKINKSLYIGITDFEAAFDRISRRKLFQKLLELGISMIMLRALVEMYLINTAHIELNGEYSRTFLMTAGVLQGSATSTILFMAYTADLIRLFNERFQIEDIIHMYHILLHADDCLILSTNRDIFEEKFRCLEEYCIENSIRLQPLKCSFITFNGGEKKDIILKNGMIKHVNEVVYLGSIITADSGVTKNVISEIRKREKYFNKFYSFLRENFNAPFSVKETVLEACVSSAVLYNCETWGNADVRNLEILYRKALKYMLGIRKTVCNEFIYVELGKPTLTSIILRRQFIFFKNCIEDKDWPLQRHIIRQAVDVNCPYINHYKKLISDYTNADEIIENSLREMKSSIIKKAENQKTRYISYLQVNPTLSRPSIYSFYVPTSMLQKTSQLRLISHNLKIELGRHTRPTTPVDERICFCGGIETETHFILDCELYHHIRDNFNIRNNDRLEYVLDNKETCNFIQRLHECRDIYSNRN